MEELDDNDKMMAALAHGISVLGFGGWGPLVMFFVFGNKPFVKYHAGQAMVFQLVVMVVVIGSAFCTFGLSTILLLPWMLLEIWLAYEAFQGKWTGYPGMSAMFKPE